MKNIEQILPLVKNFLPPSVMFCNYELSSQLCKKVFNFSFITTGKGNILFLQSDQFCKELLIQLFSRLTQRIWHRTGVHLVRGSSLVNLYAQGSEFVQAWCFDCHCIALTVNCAQLVSLNVIASIFLLYYM